MISSRKTGTSRPIDPASVARMTAMVTARTDEALNAQFGISYNTWRRIMAGHPVRASLASRLETRLQSIGAD